MCAECGSLQKCISTIFYIKKESEIYSDLVWTKEMCIEDKVVKNRQTETCEIFSISLHFCSNNCWKRYRNFSTNYEIKDIKHA